MTPTQIRILYKVFTRTGIIPSWALVKRGQWTVEEKTAIIFLDMYSYPYGYTLKEMLDTVEPYQIGDRYGTRTTGDISSIVEQGGLCERRPDTKQSIWRYNQEHHKERPQGILWASYNR